MDGTEALLVEGLTAPPIVDRSVSRGATGLADISTDELIALVEDDDSGGYDREDLIRELTDRLLARDPGLAGLW